MYGMGGRGAKKKKQKKKTGWFEKLTVEELKELARASKQPVGGNKAEIIARLLQNQSTAPYNVESRSSYSREMDGFQSDDPSTWPASDRPAGKSLDGLKNDCKENGLVVSGKKFDLALRLVQNAHGVHANGVGEPKRARVEVDETGKALLDPRTGAPVLKRRKQSTKPPDLPKLMDRVVQKCLCQQHQKSSSYFKQHAGDVMHLCNSIIQKEAIDKGFVETDISLALEVLYTVMQPVVTHINKVDGWGYEGASMGLGDINGKATRIFRAMRAAHHSMAEEDIARHKEWMGGLNKGYGMAVGMSPGCFKEELKWLNELSPSED
mmetsp:Transcript_39812/g.66787  ORF Transcript_39812/g.66787 Transcript_39812/m.66787 type:complete len:322 (-) Transcript_39812:219-1184(-)|eukprot:CAMPEP_0198207148 /NCGR_PEP_ID=MMETSP1445-20131203/10627_1 /TAXON_ID=36898 /ORGANISM="Pyramimonas sp., Strain CCMP2087" /LENGTH=321 /DNA_ID=CAMNT_0043880085 /DNA_START=327 /DNA_END=1292 /DNA_ORIENTATION=+